MKKSLYISLAATFCFLFFFSSILGTNIKESEENGYYYSSKEWMWPVPDCRIISSYFGKRDAPTQGASTFHNGIDIACKEGSNVIATKAGTVTIAQNSSSAGNFIAIQHDKHFTSYYMHNQVMFCSVGEKVEKGQVIALSGNTGISTGPHLHFGILKDGNYLNPLKFVNAKEEIEYSTTATTGIRKDMVNYAKQFIGNPYVYGGTSLINGTDCSGFTMKIYEHFDLSIPRTADAQYHASIRIEQKDLLPGDLIFYKDSAGMISHVGMYIGNHMVIHASNSKPYPEGGIKTSNMDYRTAFAYGRFIKAMYTTEDLNYLAACIAAEALSTSIDGQHAVGQVVLNRVESKAFPNTIKGVVTQNGQFNSPWNMYLNKPPEWALKASRAVLEKKAKNKIDTKCYFISLSYAKELKIEDHGICIGDNVFYDQCKW